MVEKIFLTSWFSTNTENNEYENANCPQTPETHIVPRKTI